MTNQEKILATVRSSLAHIPNVTEKKMFGKLAFMVNGKLCIATGKDEIMCRIDPSLQQLSPLKHKSVPVIMRGREMKGYVRIKNQELITKNSLSYWINLCLEFNKKIT